MQDHPHCRRFLRCLKSRPLDIFQHLHCVHNKQLHFPPIILCLLEDCPLDIFQHLHSVHMRAMSPQGAEESMMIHTAFNKRRVERTSFYKLCVANFLTRYFLQWCGCSRRTIGGGLLSHSTVTWGFKAFSEAAQTELTWGFEARKACDTSMWRAL